MTYYLNTKKLSGIVKMQSRSTRLTALLFALLWEIYFLPDPISLSSSSVVTA